jgi:hypothetical protein
MSAPASPTLPIAENVNPKIHASAPLRKRRVYPGVPTVFPDPPRRLSRDHFYVEERVSAIINHYTMASS